MQPEPPQSPRYLAIVFRSDLEPNWVAVLVSVVWVVAGAKKVLPDGAATPAKLRRWAS